MKKIEPYISKNEAIQALDNGGRFYNFATKANDGVINKAELGKVGGVFGDKQKMILFLEMSIHKLSQEDQEVIISNLDESLKAAYQKYQPQKLLPSEANMKGKVSSNAIIMGVPKLIDSKTDFQGFMMSPIVSGDVTTFMMIPLIDVYDIYEVRDEENAETFLIAHAKSSEKLPEQKVIIGGVLKELSPNEQENGEKGMFLEVIYQIR